MRSTEAGSGTNFVMQLNADTATNYSHHNLNGSGTTATSGGSATVASMDIGRAPGAGTTAGTMNATIIDIIDYASTTKYKTVRTFTGQDSNNTYAGSVTLRSGSWRSTSAITSISLILDNPFFSTLTTFALYGIKGA